MMVTDEPAATNLTLTTLVGTGILQRPGAPRVSREVEPSLVPTIYESCLLIS